MKRQRLVVEIGSACFGKHNMTNRQERVLRFLEEAMELCHAAGLTRNQIDVLADYEFAKEPGELSQECAGVHVTLYALADAYGVDLDEATTKEQIRILRNLDHLVKKHASKPKKIVAA